VSISAPPFPDIFSSQHIADPAASYRVLREHYPVSFHEPSGTWLVSRYEDVMKVLRDPLFSTESYKDQIGPVYGRTILEMDGKEHSAYRGLLNPFFHGNGLNAFTETIRANAMRLAELPLEREARAVAAGERQRGEMDLVKDFSSMFPVAVMSDMFGVPRDRWEQFAEWYHSMIAFMGNLAGEEAPRLAGLRAREEFAQYILPIIRDRRTGHGEDLISHFCHAEVNGTRMDDDEIRAFMSLMLVAGGETTDRVIAHLFDNLLAHPGQLAEVYSDRSLVDAAIAETLRYSSPVQWLQRITQRETEVGGVPIPAGSMITIMLASANLDPDRFADPERFDIHRGDSSVELAFTGAAAHLGFGAGRHYCVGAQLARREIEISTSFLLDHMHDMRRKDGFVTTPEGIFIRAIESLQVTFDPA
jgi:cytochrome P450